jgi:hypothetical protein
MPVRTNGGVFNDQMLTGSLSHWVVTGANFSGAINEFGQPVPGSAAEIIFNRIESGAYVNIMNPNEANLSFALEEGRSIWTETSLTAMIRSLGTDVGVDHLNLSGVIVTRVPYVWASGAGAESFLDLIDTPETYVGAANFIVTVKPGENGLAFTPRPIIPDTFLTLSDTPNSYIGALGYNVTVNPSGTGLIFTVPPVIPPPGPDTFLKLLDTPAAYTGASGYNVTVNPGSTGLIFTAPPVIPPPGPTTFLGLTDTPNNYVGSANFLVVVNNIGTALTFIPNPINTVSYFAHVASPSQPTINAVNNDTLTFIAGTNTTIVTNATSKSVTINSITPVILNGYIPVSPGAVLEVGKKYFITVAGTVSLPPAAGLALGDTVVVTKVAGEPNPDVFINVGNPTDVILTDLGPTDSIEMDATVEAIFILNGAVWNLQIG